MGLDMYLRARKGFDLASDEAAMLALTAGTTIEELRTMTQQNPVEHETSLYLSRWEWTEPAVRLRAIATVAQAGLAPLTVTESAGSSIGIDPQTGRLFVEVTCIYWRKANAVHAWFVEHCQDGNDDCEGYPVDVEQLGLLRHLCLDACAAYENGDKAKAGEIMEPTDGFFFGNTDVDDWWFEDMRATVDEIERVVTAAIAVGGIDFLYESSW